MSKVNLTDDDVVSMEPEYNFTGISTSTCEELINAVGELIFEHSSLARDDSDNWVKDGIPCKALLASPGGGWQKGRLRFRLEFIPDTPVSPLDDLRNNL